MARKKGPPKGRTNRTPKKTTAPDWAGPFLHALRGSSNIRAACEASGVGRRTVYDRRDSDPEFARAMAEALEDATDLLEGEARRRAYEGVERPVYGSGGAGAGTVEVGTVREYSDSLMMFLLKAHRPEKFRERYEVRHQGEVKVTVSAEEMSDDELARIAAGG